MNAGQLERSAPLPNSAGMLISLRHLLSEFNLIFLGLLSLVYLSIILDSYEKSFCLQSEPLW